MTLRPDEIVAGFDDEMRRFGELIAPLSAEQWATPSRCEGWTVADVAAHAIGSEADVAAGRLEGLGSPEATAREVEERRGRTPGELADELEAARKQVMDLAAVFDEAAWQSPAPGGYDGTLAQGVEALYYDMWMHADDIRAALGLESVRSGGLRAAVHHLANELSQHGWGPATLALDGIEEVSVAGDGAGHGTITGDPIAFVLVATGRKDPASLGFDETVNVYR